MKKFALSALAALSFCFASAQEVTFEYKLGLNLSNINGDFSSSNKLGLYGGAAADLMFSDNFGARAELLLSQEGAKDIGLTYLRLPLLAKYNFSEEFSLAAGPNVGYLLGSELESRIFNSLDLGFSMGMMYKFFSGFYIDARYTHGLTNISNTLNKSYNTNFSFGIGYRQK